MQQRVAEGVVRVITLTLVLVIVIVVGVLVAVAAVEAIPKMKIMMRISMMLIDL